MDLNTASSPLPFPRFTMPRSAYDTTGVAKHISPFTGRPFSHGLSPDKTAPRPPSPHPKKIFSPPTLPHNEAPLREEAPNEHPQPPQQNVTKKA